MLPRFASAFLFAVVAMTPACTVQLGSSSEGENGRAQLSYADSCLLGCAVDHPMLAGSRVRVSLSGVPEVFAVSENTEVLSVTTEHSYSCCNSSSSCTSTGKNDTCPSGAHKELKQTLVIDARADGNARVQFVGGSEPVDAFTFEVRDPSSATLHLESNDRPIDTLTMSMGGGVTLQLDLRDSEGRLLEAPNGVRLRSEDARIASFEDPSWFGSSEGVPVFELQSNPFSATPTLEARAPGSTTLQILTRGFARDIPVIVR
ncbi:MAG: hypothetical protein ACXWUG_03790 [Polyangiales bacterium]